MTSDETSDALAQELNHAADEVEVGETRTMLAAVHTTATRRRRRRNALVGLAAAATLAVSGVVVAQFMSGNTGDDMIVSAPVTEPADTEPADTEPVATEPLDLESSATDQIVPDPGVVAVADDEADAESGAPAVVADPAASNRVIPSAMSVATDPGQSPDDGTGQNEVFPWKGGVLSVRTTYPPQALPTELPTDIVEAFPPEVQELFPDGLPPTISEATEVLSEAGLLDEVTQVLADNAAVSDAIYSQPTEAPIRTVRFSPDGVEWTDIDASFPPGDDIWSGAVSTGERFVFARSVVSADTPLDDVAVRGRPPVPDAIEIHSSTNLVDWSVQTIDAPERPIDIDPAFPFEVYSHGLAATDSGYVISVDAMAYVDFVELLEPELRDRVYSGGASTTQGSDGVTIDLYGSSGAGGAGDPEQIVESLTFTWAELGLSGPPPTDGAQNTYRYSGTWDGGAAPVVTDIEGGWSDVRAVGDVFVELGPSAQRSADGVEWVPFETPGGGSVDAIVATGNGVAVRDSEGRGNSATYVGDLEGGAWTPVDTPDLPDHVYPEISGPGAFLLADQGGGGPDPYADAVAVRERAEVDGYLYETEHTWEAESGDDNLTTYRLTDLASGEVVVTETSDGSSPDEPFEYIDYESGFGNGFEILDPESGEPLVTIPYMAVSQEIVNADGSITDPSTFEYPDQAMEEFPEYWVMASLDDGWVVQQLETDVEQGGYPSSVVALDDMALVALSDGTILRVTAA